MCRVGSTRRSTTTRRRSRRAFRTTGTSRRDGLPTFPNRPLRLMGKRVSKPHGLLTPGTQPASRVCNAVCNGFGHGLAGRGTNWHGGEVCGLAQARARGAHGHALASCDTNTHDLRIRFDSCRAYTLTWRVRGRNGGFGAEWVFAGSSVQCSVQLVRPHGGTAWHSAARSDTGRGRPREHIPCSGGRWHIRRVAADIGPCATIAVPSLWVAVCARP
jgi:hypothetical protein